MRLVIRRPDDWHVHLRDGPMLAEVLDYTARQFARAIVMPNLDPPVTTMAEAVAYRLRIQSQVRAGRSFAPLMTAYLTDSTDAGDLAAGFEQGVFTAAKLYPAHATTNSAKGVTEVGRIHGVLETMQRIGMPLLVHGEVTNPDVDIFDREAVFVERILAPVVHDFPGLKVVCEHITTEEAAGFVLGSSAAVAATITPHHLQCNRNAMFQGGIRPHLYCLPVLKREKHRLALRKAATSGSPKFFLGTDSAPHAVGAKESACGCAGVFNAPVALEAYATVFEEENALDRFEAFASEHGARFYGLPLNEGRVTLTRAPSLVPERIQSNTTTIIPYHAGTTLAWRFEG
ncbi:MAG: dihydroorotase [Gemmatimonadetes bacterium]|nr:dihydroorotase [Gemmatimonadota bacterium]